MSLYRYSIKDRSNRLNICGKSTSGVDGEMIGCLDWSSDTLRDNRGDRVHSSKRGWIKIGNTAHLADGNVYEKCVIGEF